MDDNFGHIYLTADLPGIGGRIKERPEDFIVEEIPLYEPSEQGGFTFLQIEKTNLSTLDLVSLIRTHLDLEDHQVGLAGWKDKRAVTRQWVSVPREKVSADRLDQLNREGVQVQRQRHHSHKLRTGHLLGNRFSVLIRQTEPDAELKAGPIIHRLQKEGLPNFYGRQRFGTAGDNPERGLALLLGRERMRSVRKRKLLISAYASLLFNYTLRERIKRELFIRVILGDVAKKHDTGGLFLVKDPVVEQPRADRLEISATGPIWGKKTKRASDLAAALEEEILTNQKLTPEAFRKQPGSRRSLRVPLKEITIQQQSEGLRLEFLLPKGSYATVLLDEIMKA